MTPCPTALGTGRPAGWLGRGVTAAVVSSALLVAAACTSGGREDPTADGAPRSASTGAEVARDGFDRTVTELREDVEPYRDLVPGGMLLVRHGDRHQTFTWGLANTRTRTPMRPTAPFPIASITKPMLAVRVMQLVEDGRLRLDDTVARWLPGLVPDGDRVTIEQLLSHRSGLPAHDELPRRWTIATDWDQADLAQAMRTGPGLGTPGRETDYSNAGYLVLGLLVEAVDPHPLPQQLARHVFAPAGMDHTSLHPAVPHNPRLVHGYTADGKDVTPRDLTGVWAAGGVVSTLQDLDRFATALFDHRLLENQSVEDMSTSRGTFVTTGYPGEYGLGLWRWPFDCGDALGHSGLLRGYSTGLFHHPDRDTTLVVMVNTEANFGVMELFGNDALCPQ